MSVEAEQSTIREAALQLSKARSALFITGAGLSADSGLPTYRGIGGLYNDIETRDGISIEEALSGQMLKRDPALCWRYIHQLENACRGAAPNKAHELIAALEQRLDRVWVLTQNVDSLHQRAGSKKIIDIHGDVRHLYCTDCGQTKLVEDYSNLPPLPLCENCEGVMRPNVVLFGEMLPPDKLRTLDEELRRGFDVVFSIGTTSVFPYIAGPVLLAKRSGRPTIEINPGVTEVSNLVDLRIKQGAARAMQGIWDEMQG